MNEFHTRVGDPNKGGASTMKGRVTAYRQRSLAIGAPQDGPRVPSASAVLLARKILTQGVPAFGAYPCIDFLNEGELFFDRTWALLKSPI